MTDTNGYVSPTADTDGYGLVTPLSRMGGMSLFNKPEPDGYSEFGRNWLSTANLDERWRFAQHLLMASNYGLKNTDYGTTRNISDPSALKLRGGSHEVTVEVDSIPGPKDAVILPPTFSSIWHGTNHEETPCPVAIACQTCSGVPGTIVSETTERRPDGSIFTLIMIPLLWVMDGR
jgi:hypothetical protein